MAEDKASAVWKAFEEYAKGDDSYLPYVTKALANEKYMEDVVIPCFEEHGLVTMVAGLPTVSMINMRNFLRSPEYASVRAKA